MPGRHSQGEWVMFKGIRLAVYTAIFAFCSVSMGGIEPASAAVAMTPGKGEIVAQVQQRGHTIPIYQIGEMEEANTAQGMDGYAIQVAYVLHAWTRAHGVEAIGNLCRSPDGARWGSVFLTMYAHTTSPRTDACPAGMKPSGVDIHSHPQRHRYPVNDVDRWFLQNGLMGADYVSTRPDVFSPDDMQAPGYLVGQISLHYQDGHDGQGRIVWHMHNQEPAALAADH